MSEVIEIISFYEFRAMESLEETRAALTDAMRATEVRGTIILAAEGYNGMVCGTPDQVAAFVPIAEQALGTKMRLKSAFHAAAPFRKIDIKIKPEIVTLKRPVNLGLGQGTHVSAAEWNDIIRNPETLVLDARNDYEYRTGTFAGAVNPGTSKFSELPAFVAENLDPAEHKRVAMFCTGGIRCEKFAPYLIEQGFDEVYQLEGGILRYLEEIPTEDSLWQGECFVFDERITVDHDLQKGRGPDLSQRHPERSAAE